MTANITAHTPSGSSADGRTVLEVSDLTIDIHGDDVQRALVDHVSFSVNTNETVALIGESGCGKTMTAMAVLGLLPRAARTSNGTIHFGDIDLMQASASQLRRIRGGRIGTIFQDPMASLNPRMRVGRQVAEVRVTHLGETWATAGAEAIRLFGQVGIPHPESRVHAFPHELSGGMQQRVMIAMAIACEPELLIADEPTTALDVTIQAEILDLLDSLKKKREMGILLVTHDLGVVAEHADRTVVMYAGQVAETAQTASVFHHSRHPYTSALMDAVPKPDKAREMLETIPGRVPVAGTFPPGCRFFARCRFAQHGVCDDPAQFQTVAATTGSATSCVRAPSIFSPSE